MSPTTPGTRLRASSSAAGREPAVGTLMCDSMLEAALQSTVLAMAKTLDVYSAHFPKAQNRGGQWRTAVAGDGKGFTDLVLVGATGILYAELKQQSEYLKPAQREWQKRILAAGGVHVVWKPRDLRSGRIERELRAIADPRHAARIPGGLV